MLIVAYIVEDIGGELSCAWIANTLATAAVSPFVGVISDLIGHRYVGLLGSILVIMGLIAIGVAQTVEVGRTQGNRIEVYSSRLNYLN